MKKVDVAVVGGGVVGAACALGLAQRGIRVALVEKKPHQSRPLSTGYDVRASSINLASVRFLKNLHAWDAMHALRVNPFREIQVWDAAGHGSIHFNSADIGEPCLGYIIEHQVIVEALYQRLRENNWCYEIAPDSVDALHIQPDSALLQLASGEQLSARLVVGADGSRSAIRGMAGIQTDAFAQHHHAVVATVGLSRPHAHTAWQRFLPSGPLAFLPLNEHISSIVWSLPQAQADLLTQMDETEFCRELAQAMQQRFGELHLLGPRVRFPLQPQHAKHYCQSRLCLIGDAAHSIHPLAGQGVNLGLLDAASLIEVVQDAFDRREDPGQIWVLRRYERWRKGHNLAMLQIMQGFAELFASRDSFITWLRNTGLNMTDHLFPLKQKIMQFACGIQGDLPALAQRTRNNVSV